MIDFKAALRVQALRGQALIEARREAQDTQQYYYRRLAEKRAREEHQARLAKLRHTMSASKDGKELTWPILRAILKQNVNTAKQSLFVHLHRGLLALMYSLGLGGFPDTFCNSTREVVFSPDMSASGLQKRFVELKDHYNEKRDVQPFFELQVGTSIEMGSVFDASWKDILASDDLLRIPFRIPSTLEEFGTRCRTRITAIR